MARFETMPALCPPLVSTKVVSPVSQWILCTERHGAT
jgi:hypothetical protein